MNKSGAFGEILERGQSAVGQTGKAAAKAAHDTAKAAGAQITGNDVSDRDIVKSLYGVSSASQNQSKTQGQQHPQGQTPSQPKSLEEQKKLKELRSQLHSEVYYQPLINPPKPKEEERPAEKVEKEKKEEKAELFEKEKEKPPPLAIARTQQRVEKFPGRSG